jgi:AcrR family transcriptional regulator
VAPGTTAAALIDAAEEHFAVDGFERASLRAMMRAAGADPGSVHYHFGGREALAGAVLDRILAPLNARRMDLLSRAEERHRSTGSPVPLPELVECLARPDLEAALALGRRGRERARLIGLIYLNPAAFVTERVEAHFAPVAGRFLPGLVAVLPGLAPDLIAWRVRWFLYGVLGALLADPDEPFAVEPSALTARIVASTTAALAAPTPVPAPPGSDPEENH